MRTFSKLWPSLSVLTLLLVSQHSADAQVGIGTTAPNAKAALDIVSSDKGVLLPRLTQAQRGAISSPPAGLLVYQTDGLQPGFWYYEATGGWTYLNPLGDNLGNHTATQNVKLNNNWLSNDGDAEGVNVTSAGRVGVGMPGDGSWKLAVGDASSNTLLMQDTRSLGNQRGPGIGLAVGPVGSSYVGGYFDYIHSDALFPYRNNSVEIRSSGSSGSNGRINFFAGANASLTTGPHATIRENGAVGIGLNDPAKKLHLYSTKQYDGLRIQVGVSSGFGSISSIEYWSGVPGSANVWRPAMIRTSNYGSGLAFYTNGTGTAHKTDSMQVMHYMYSEGKLKTAIGMGIPDASFAVKDTASSVKQVISLFEGNSKRAGISINTLKATALGSAYGYLSGLSSYVGTHYLGRNGEWVLQLGITSSSGFYWKVIPTKGFMLIGPSSHLFDPKQQLHLNDVASAKLRIQSKGSAFGYSPTGLEFWSGAMGASDEWRPGMIRATTQGDFTGGLAFYVNGSGAGARQDSIEVMRLTNRMVGIGTSDPQTKLHIVTDNSTGGAEDDYTLDTYGNNGNTGINGLLIRKSRGSVAAPQNLQYGDRVGAMSFVPRANNSFGWAGAGIESYYMGNGGTGLMDLRFLTGNGGLGMRLTETGNLGLGAILPNTRLSITPVTNEAKITLWDNNSQTSHTGFGVSNNGQLNYEVNTTSDNHVFRAGGKNGSGGVELAQLTGTGRLGIGTIPLSPLHVRGGSMDNFVAQFDGTSSFDAYVTVNATNSASSPFYAYMLAGANRGSHGIDAASGDFVLRVGATTTARLTVEDVTGNVGIGVAPGTARLAVSAAVASPAISATSSATGTTPTVSVANTANGVALALLSGNLSFSTSSLAAPLSTTTLSPTTVVVSYVSNANAAANGAVTLTAGLEGQLLIVSNQDSQSITVGSTTIPNGSSQRFVFVNSAWRAF